MWARFTENARKVIFYAQEEAQARGQTEVGTEHLLLGLLREEENTACQTLIKMGVDLRKLQETVLKYTSKGQVGQNTFLQLTPRAKQVIDLAYEEARGLNNDYIGTEHLLLGIVREAEGLAAKLLAQFQVDLETARQMVMELQDRQEGDLPPPEEASPPASTPDVQSELSLSRFTSQAQQVLVYAHETVRQLGGTEVRTEHLLLGALSNEANAACRVLERMGISIDRVRQEVERFTQRGDEVPDDTELTLTPRAQRVIDLAHTESRKLHNDYLGTEHLLLGLIMEGEGLAARILTKLGALYTMTLEQVKAIQSDTHGSTLEQIPEQQPFSPEQGDSNEVLQAGISGLPSPELLQQLAYQALMARACAYAPYSRYEVGAAVLVDDDQIYAGCNVENASFGLSVCAERVAIFNAIAAGTKHVKAVAVATQDGGTPCGACRQVISEFADDPAQCLILMVKSEQEWEMCTLEELLPKPFDF